MPCDLELWHTGCDRSCPAKTGGSRCRADRARTVICLLRLIEAARRVSGCRAAWAVQVREVGTVFGAVGRVARDIWQRLTSRSRHEGDSESAKAERARWVEEAARAADLDGIQRRTLP